MSISLKIKNKHSEFLSRNVKHLRIIEEEGKLAKATMFFECDNKLLGNLKACEIWDDDRIIFKGKVTNQKLEKNELKVELISEVEEETSHSEFNPDETIVDKFKQENPDLFVSLDKKDYTPQGKTLASDVLRPAREPIPISNSMLTQFGLEKNYEQPINELDLQIKGSWISRREGLIGISTEIEKRFKMSRINTLTPKKLNDSWPQFGERFSGRNRGTKYFVGQSRLKETETTGMLPIKIDSDIEPINLTKHIFDNKLSIAWDYDQFMTETVNLKLINNLEEESFSGVFRPALEASDQLDLNLNKKTLSINLKNVQEYVDSYAETSFFRSDSGQQILNEIVKSFAHYMLLSMRNCEITFECLEKDLKQDMSCQDWVCVNGVNYKIVMIEREMSSDIRKLKIKARAFGFRLPESKLIDEIMMDKPEVKDVCVDDILEDIIVYNEASEQYKKLLEHISELKKEGKINLSNYRSIVTRFLNMNQTEIRIRTKPLKKEHCERGYIDLGSLYLYGKGDQNEKVSH